MRLQALRSPAAKADLLTRGYDTPEGVS